MESNKSAQPASGAPQSTKPIESADVNLFTSVINRLPPSMLFVALVIVIMALGGLMIYSVWHGNTVDLTWSHGLTVTPKQESDVAFLDGLKPDSSSKAAVEAWANQHGLFCTEISDFDGFLKMVATFPANYERVAQTAEIMKASVAPVRIKVTVSWASSIEDTDLLFEQGEQPFPQFLYKPCQFPQCSLTLRVNSTAILENGWVQISEANFVKMLVKLEGRNLPTKGSAEWKKLTKIGLLKDQELVLNVAP